MLLLPGMKFASEVFESPHFEYRARENPAIYSFYETCI